MKKRTNVHGKKPFMGKKLCATKWTVKENLGTEMEGGDPAPARERKKAKRRGTDPLCRGQARGLENII